MTHTVRCGDGDCNYWLGESPEPLVCIEVVDKGTLTHVDPPRDLRVCKSCGRVSVFIMKKDLDPMRTAAVSSG